MKLLIFCRVYRINQRRKHHQIHRETKGMPALNGKRTSKKSSDRQNNAIRYRAYPTEGQVVLFNKTVGCKRKIWNLILADRKKAWQNERKTIKPTPAQYKDKYPYLKEVDSLALCNAQIDLDQSFSNFFNNPKHFRYPKLKCKRKEHPSYTTNYQAYTKKDGTLSESIHVGNKFIRLPKMGYVKIVKHREVPSEWMNAEIKSATFSRESDGAYYISVLYEFELEAQETDNSVIDIDKVIAFDYKSDGLFCDSNGKVADMPKYFRKSEKKLAKLQRELSRKTRARKNEDPSKNYLKQKKKVGKLHQHIANQRLDHHHKKSKEIANLYDIVFIEDLEMKGIANKKRHLGKSTMDNAWGLFTTLLKYKLEDRGKILIRVDRFFPSSQICSNCGHKQKLSLSERTYKCPSCGTVIDRDHNAAINIRNEGLNVLRSEDKNITFTTAGAAGSHACEDKNKTSVSREPTPADSVHLSVKQ